MDTIVNKIKKSVQSGTGLTCLYGSLDSINVQMGDQTEFPVAFFVLLNNGSLDNRSSNYRERVDVAMFFVKPTEFDFESIENEALIADCKQYAFQWLNSLFLGGDLRYITTLNTSRVYNQMDDILTGYALRVRLEELVGECITQPEPPIPDYLRFTALENGTIGWNSSTYPNLYWSKNNKVWNQFDSTITVDDGEFVLFRGDNWGGSDTNLHFTTTGTFDLSGNIMSLCDSSLETDTIPEGVIGYFSDLFNGCGIVDASALELPVMELTDDCYSGMFDGCSLLVNAPLLPAMTLAVDCYHHMFADCTSLATAPELPATELADSCYMLMFYGCTSLTSSPVLPALEGSTEGYQAMFSGCTNLSRIEAWFVSPDPARYAISSHWVRNVSPTGTFVKNAAAEWNNTFSDSVIPEGWNVVEKTIE